jgi:hypothetical protein
VKPPDVTAVTSLYFMTVPLAFKDEMWSKYKFGEHTKVNDTTTKAPAIRNVFAQADAGSETLSVEGMVPPPADASITALQSRGGIFLLCNNALNFWTQQLASGTGGKAEDIRAELLANSLPNIYLVPAMVVAFDQAQKHGCSYMYLA